MEFEDKLFIHKFQPIYFEEFEIDESVIAVLNTLIKMDNLNILFIGDMGSGKTSLLNALIKEYYKDNSSTNNYNDNICLLYTSPSPRDS